MTTSATPFTRVGLAPELSPGLLWLAVAAQARRWCDEQNIALRDTVLLLPFAGLLPSARAAFAAQGGWAPRIETPRTLAESLGPVDEGGGPGEHAAEDRLAAAALLEPLSMRADWQRRDPRGFRFAVDALASTAARLAQGAAARAPAMRPDFWQALRAAAGAGDGPDALERALLRLAIEWAADAPVARSEGLFGLQPAGWIVVQVGGSDPVAAGLLQASAVPGLLIDADPPSDDPYVAVAQPACTPTLICCDDFETEAQATADQVLRALVAGQAPVALVTLDRVLVRRVRALLERSQVSLADETGWKLSTTRAGARVMAWLRAARAQASGDERLAWLKAWPPAKADPDARRCLQSLEARWRRGGQRAVVDDPLWQAGRDALARLSPRPQQTLQAWCQALADALAGAGEWQGLADDEAGRGVLQALKLDPPAGPAWTALARTIVLSLDGFIAWADDELEAASFTLSNGRAESAEGRAEVVLTPLARAVLRPFGHVVVPGVDARQLGGAPPPPGLIGDALATRLGLEAVGDIRLRQRLAFAQLLRAPALTLLRRRLEGDEPLAASPEVQWLMLRRQEAGLPVLVETAATPPMDTVASTPVTRPLPVAAQSLPPSLSASQVEQLRACPYQFFARSLLRLSEPDELDRGVEKRDFGSWLHAVLYRFHQASAGQGDEAERLAQAAEDELAAMGFEEAELLPYRASFEAFAPRYLAWWNDRSAHGWRWREGETERRVTPEPLSPTGLHGRLDRLDERGQVQCVVDYKTSRLDTLRRRVKQATEDTQLAFYAALLSPRAPDTLQAAYLTLDDPQAPELVMHPQVQETADTLVHGLAEDLRQLRGGAPLPALGEGAACEHCDVRGLCRRDHWRAG